MMTAWDVPAEVTAGEIARRLLGQTSPGRSPGAFGPKLRNIREVQEAFARQQAGYVENLASDGVSLWSYSWWEMARWVPFSPGQAICVRRRGKNYSMTTAQHISGIKAETYPATCETPQGSASMQL